MKKAIILSILLFVFALNPSTTLADYGSTQCQPIYGGGESCATTPQIEINKTVQNPATKLYVDNLFVNGPKFGIGQTVTFKITVKNTSKDKLTNLTISDILPNYVDFVSGVGTFDTKSKTLTIKLDKLDSDEVRDFFIQAKISSNLPADQSVTCVVNQSMVVVSDKKAQDNAQFCIEKNPTVTKGGLKVFPPTKVEKTPETGPEAIALFGLIPSAIGGLFLRKKSLKSHFKGGDK